MNSEDKKTVKKLVPKVNNEALEASKASKKQAIINNQIINKDGKDINS